MRCTWHLQTNTKNANNFDLKDKQQQVIRLLQQTLSRADNSNLNYYQGYADIACIIWNIFQNDNTSIDHGDTTMTTAVKILSQLSHRHLETIMSANFVPLQTTLSLIWNPLLDYVNPILFDVFQQAGIEEGSFAISWILTWFSHDVKDTSVVKQLFDACLVSHALFPIYLSISLLNAHSSTLIELAQDGGEEALYPMLSQLPHTTQIWQTILDDSLCLMERVPPHQLKALSKHYFATTGKTITTSIPTTWNVTDIPWLQPYSCNTISASSLSQYPHARIAMGYSKQSSHRAQMTLLSLCVAYIFATEVLLVPTVVVWGMVLNQTQATTTTGI